MPISGVATKRNWPVLRNSSTLGVDGYWGDYPLHGLKDFLNDSFCDELCAIVRKVVII